ncbi:MAG: hypothetical protein HYX89_04255 [Chloroflexi bacterium]|nr:hypothetical protein [Chloroflexota bacterium]
MGKNSGARKLRDASAAVFCAESFQSLAQPFIERIAQDVKEGSRGPSRELGELVSSATNLALALEIYLKTLRAQLGMPVPRTHDLSKLYDDLPDAVRTEIEAEYDMASRSLRRGDRVAITVAKGPRTTPHWQPYGKDRQGLAGLLKRSRHVFESWRYIYEFEPQDSGYQFHEFEYRLLVLACEAVKANIKNRESRVAT